MFHPGCGEFDGIIKPIAMRSVSSSRKGFHKEGVAHHVIVGVG
jgi:hypothetical protein